MIRILFVYFPLYVNFNHGAALLTAICNKYRDIEADYMPCGNNFLSCIKEYDIIGFSFVTDADYQQCIPYIHAAYEAGKLIMAGGVYARRGGKIDKRVSLICRGEGEILPDYLLRQDKRVFNEKYRHEDLDNLPMLDLRHVTGSEFHRGLPFLQGLKIMPYQTSRGCFGSCSFCEVQFQPKGLRIKHTIANDLNALKDKYCPDLIYLMDELPPYYFQDWRSQWEGLHVPFISFIRADIKPDELDFMIKHGLKVTAFGVESGSESFRNKTLRKGITDEQINQTVRILNENNVVYMPFFISNIPGEADNDKKETQSMIENIGGFPMVWEYQNLKASIKTEVKIWEPRQ